MFDRSLLAKLSQCAWKVLSHYLKQSVPYEDAAAGAVIAVQSFDDFLGFNSHLHVIGTDGCFYGNGSFKTCPAPNPKDLDDLFRYEVFKMLKAEGKINDTVIENMLNWPLARRAYASESITVALTFIAATPFGRTMKKALRTWHTISFEPPFHKSA